jgi:ribosomal protein S4
MFNKRKIFKYKFCRLVGVDLWGYYYKNIKGTKIKKYFIELAKNKRIKKKVVHTQFSYYLDPNEKVEKKIKRRSFYFKLLFNKQKFKKYYSNITIKQIKKNVKIILKRKFNLLNNFAYFFEMRLDSIIYRANFAYSFANARQLIKHGFILVNKVKVTHVSFLIKPGDYIEICDNKKQYLYNLLKNRLFNKLIITSAPRYLQVNYNLLGCIVIKYPLYSEIPFLKNFEIISILNI